MSVGPGWRRLFRLPGADRHAMEQALDDELEFHLAMREEKLHEQGLSTEDAHARALTRFGDRDRIRAECLTIDRHYAREISVMEWIESVMADVRYAARTLRRAPAFTAIAVTTLALGVGATTAIFSLVDGILLRPLPYPEPQRLVRVLMSYPEKGLDSWSLSQQNVAVFRARVTDFAHLAGYSRRGMTLTSDAGAERLNALLVTNDFFPTLAVRPVLGRLPADSEVTATSAQVAVLGYGFWQTRFGASPGVIGKVLDVEGTPTRVVAVMPPGFAFPRPDVQVYVPFAIDATKRFGWFLTGIARLKPGVSAEHAERQLTSAMWTWARENPDLLSVSSIRPEATRMRGLVVSLREATTGAVARPLAVLQAAVALLLLIAVANIATLVSSRSAVRSPEIAVRTALGASARRVARQLVTESLVVAVIGGVCGIALAIVAVRLFGKWNAGDLPRMDEVSIDWRVLAFALLVSVASGILFGLAPATRMARSRRLADDLVGAQKGSVRGSTRRLNNALIVAQMALSVVLLISAGLMLKSFRRLTKTELGFEPRGVVSMTVPLPMKKYMDAGAAAAATQTIVERVRAIPGVRSAAAASGIPYSGSVNTDGFLVEGHAPPPNAGAETQVVEVSVTPGFFEAMRIPLRYGRDFSAADRANTLPVVIVDDAFARRFWAGSDAIGKRMRFTGDTTMQTIIGVVSSVRDEDVAAEGRPHAYQPYTQLPSQRPSLVISTAGDPSSVVAAVRRAISELEPGAPLVNVRPISDAVAQTLQNRRLTELLLSGFALLAVALAAVGIYGVMTLYVASRTREFGIRLAVGAEPSRLVRLVLGEGLVLASTGVVLGVAAALVATRWLLAILYEVSPTDPVVFSTLAVGLLAVAAAACYRPARRAAGVDPQVALRGE